MSQSTEFFTKQVLKQYGKVWAVLLEDGRGSSDVIGVFASGAMAEDCAKTHSGYEGTYTRVVETYFNE